MSPDYSKLPADLPAPTDDGATAGLEGTPLPDLALPSSLGGKLSLPAAGAGLLVAYVYPMTGTPGRALPSDWDDIPGARGCTPQSCAYREAEGRAFYRRLTFVAEAGRIVKVLYPVFPPDRDAIEVLTWLRGRGRGRGRVAAAGAR